MDLEELHNEKLAAYSRENEPDRFRPLEYEDIKDDPPIPDPEEEILYEDEGI